MKLTEEQVKKWLDWFHSDRCVCQEPGGVFKPDLCADWLEMAEMCGLRLMAYERLRAENAALKEAAVVAREALEKVSATAPLWQEVTEARRQLGGILDGFEQKESSRAEVAALRKAASEAEIRIAELSEKLDEALADKLHEMLMRHGDHAEIMALREILELARIACIDLNKRELRALRSAVFAFDDTMNEKFLATQNPTEDTERQE